MSTGRIVGIALPLLLLAATVLFGAVLLALAVRDRRNACRAERAARPPDGSLSDAIDAVAAQALAMACCDAWWTSCGFLHTTTCPNHRKTVR